DDIDEESSSESPGDLSEDPQSDLFTKYEDRYPFFTEDEDPNVLNLHPDPRDLLTEDDNMEITEEESDDDTARGTRRTHGNEPTPGSSMGPPPKPLTLNTRDGTFKFKLSTPGSSKTKLSIEKLPQKPKQKKKEGKWYQPEILENRLRERKPSGPVAQAVLPLEEPRTYIEAI
ncbi:unnamed protein product, partial [Allacma fusca]